MTDSSSRRAANYGKSTARTAERRTLSYDQAYVCPICRHGQIASLALMDVFACNFCRHIFTANLADQVVRVEDSSQLMSWRWNGYTWTTSSPIDVDLTLVVWILGGVLVIVPPALIWLPAHVFPPAKGSMFDWLPTAWVSLTFLIHFLIVVWLLLDHYQFPLYISFKIRFQDWLARRSM